MISALRPLGCPPIVLLVDDDPGVRRPLSRQLNDIGMRVIEARTGLEGLKLASTEAPDLIILDLSLPDIDGHTFLRRLRNQPFACKVIVLSGNTSPDEIVEALRTGGAVDFLAKPWSVGALGGAIARALADFPQGADPAPDGALAQPLPAPVTARVPRMRNALDGFEVDLRTVLDRQRIVPVAQRALIDLRQPSRTASSSTATLLKLLATDESLSARVLRVANTALYASGDRFGGVRAALSRLGSRTIETIAQTILAPACFRARDPRLPPLSRSIWRHSLARALAARALAARVRLDPDALHEAALFADCGAPLLYWALAEHHEGAVPCSLEECQEYVNARHEALGSELLLHWGFSEMVVETARAHHGRGPAVRSAGHDVIAVAGELADLMAPEADLTGRREFEPSQLLAASSRCGLGSGDLQPMAQSLQYAFREICGALE